MRLFSGNAALVQPHYAMGIIADGFPTNPVVRLSNLAEPCSYHRFSGIQYRVSLRVPAFRIPILLTLRTSRQSIHTCELAFFQKLAP